MAQNRTLDSFWQQEAKPVKPQPKQAQAEIKPEPQTAPTTPVAPEKAVAPVKKERKPRVLPPLAPTNLPPSYFVSAAYDGRQQKAIVKLYEPESGELYFWYDNTGHKPYCLTSLSKEKVLQFDRIIHHEGYDSCTVEQRFDPLANQQIQVTKIVTKDPLAIGGRPNGTIRDIIPEDHAQVCGCQIQDSDTKVWESKIKYYQSYIYDQKILPGMIYQVRNGNLGRSHRPRSRTNTRQNQRTLQNRNC